MLEGLTTTRTGRRARTSVRRVAVVLTAAVAVLGTGCSLLPLAPSAGVQADDGRPCAIGAVRSCALPYPSDEFTVADPTSSTGRRIEMPPELVPAALLDQLGPGATIDDAFGGADGFSAITPVDVRGRPLGHPVDAPRRRRRRAGGVRRADRRAGADPRRGAGGSGASRRPRHHGRRLATHALRVRPHLRRPADREVCGQPSATGSSRRPVSPTPSSAVPDRSTGCAAISPGSTGPIGGRRSSTPPASRSAADRTPPASSTPWPSWSAPPSTRSAGSRSSRRGSSVTTSLPS